MMRFELERVKEICKKLEDDFGETFFMPQNLIIRLQHCGYLRLVDHHPRSENLMEIVRLSSFSDHFLIFWLIIYSATVAV